ncbi:NAD(P)-binding protein [Paraphaeosphaeria sporulosa]|uniref:NAD(P)-binding protein n=1 Tax=Paraphaeosphaeria sporulosa TaxID=1460663 RepID=A0A177CQJ8_9PLEO|nr:NAD(P)-binding protein [Paraphaeosphaeria sporulosa]OAG09170.1 NAD(P)-binding protein [Paraphaeosphaeria sporulosa]
MGAVLLYGAYGYTGLLATEHAIQTGLDVVLAGRTRKRLQDLASSLNLPYRTFNVSDSAEVIDSVLSGVSVILNCAGPFHRTALPLMKACLRNRVHYLDIAAELDSYFQAEELDQEAKRAGIMLLPGCGGSVAMLGCLAQRASERMESPVHATVALHVSGPMSRGSAISAQEGAIAGENYPPSNRRRTVRNAEGNKNFDFGDGRGLVECFPATLPDLITIRKSTGASTVYAYVHVSGNSFPVGDLGELPLGPELEERERHPYHAVVEIQARNGSVERAVLQTVNGYTFTAITSVEAARRVAAGSFLPGFQTPAEMFSGSFLDCVDGSVIKEGES